MEIAAQSVDVALPFERPLYEPSRRTMVDDAVTTADDADVDAGALFSQFHVDTERLKSNIEDVLAGAEQATLGDVTDAHPLSQGLAEIVAYFQLATESDWAAINPDQAQHLSWQLPDGSTREATSTRSSSEASMNPADAPETHAPETRTPEELPGVVTRLFKGVVYAEADEKAWQSLLGLSSHVRDYVAVLGLDLILDESEGYAFLKSREDPDGTLPRLIPRRPLTFNVSLLLALLRGRMLEFDTNSSELRLIMTEQDIADMVAVFLPESSNEARILDQLATEHQESGGTRLPAQTARPDRHLRGRPHPQGLRGCPMAGGIRRAAGRLPASLTGSRADRQASHP